MFCSNCGNKLNDNAAFCANCGTAVKVEAAPLAEPVVPVAEPVAPVAAPVAPVAEPVAPVAEPVASVAAPVAPVAAPVAPVAQPVAPVAEPVAPVAEPVASVAAPVAPVAQPVNAQYAYNQMPGQQAMPAAGCPTAKSVLIKGILGAAFACTFWLSFLGIIFGSLAVKEADAFAAFNGLTGMAKIGRILGKAGKIVGIVLTAILALYLFIIIIAGLA